MIGVDFASVDGNKPVDWKAARAAGVRFAFIRAAHGPTVDPTYAREASRARAAGVQVGAYGIIEWTSASAALQAAALVGQVQAAGKPCDLPTSCDVEYSGSLPSHGFAPLVVLTRVAVYVANVIAGTGAACVYTSQNQWSANVGDLDSHELGAIPLWLKTSYTYRARRPPATSPAGDPRIGQLGVLPRPWRREGSAGVWWQQHQGDAIGMPGFSSTVDINTACVYREPGPRIPDPRAAWVRAQLARHGCETIRALQDRHGLDADGVAGPATLAVLTRRAL